MNLELVNGRACDPNIFLFINRFFLGIFLTYADTEEEPNSTLLYAWSLPRTSIWLRYRLFLGAGLLSITRCREIRLQACHKSTRFKLGADPGLSRSWESAGEELSMCVNHNHIARLQIWRGVKMNIKYVFIIWGISTTKGPNFPFFSGILLITITKLYDGQ